VSRLLGVLACILAGALVSQSTGSDGPIWTQQIVSDLSRSRNGLSPLLLDTNRAGIAFLGNEQILVHATEHTNQLSSRSSPEISSAFRLHIWVLDAKSGKLTFTKDDLGTRVHNSAVQVTTGGVLVDTGGIVRLFSPDFSKNSPLKLPLDKGENLITSVSPTGRTILVNRVNQALNVSRFDVFDADTLRIRKSWSESPPLYHQYSISDGEIVALSDRSVIASQFGSAKWNVLDGGSKSDCIATSPTLVTNELMIVRECKDLLHRTTAGASFSLGRLSENDSDEPSADHCDPYDGRLSDKSAVASGGRSVALSVPAIKINKHVLTESSICLTAVRIAVYDIAARKRILTVNVDPMPKSDYDFAVSPDGSKLAILNDRKVSIFALPLGTPGHVASTQ
jgi:hypothetical protein